MSLLSSVTNLIGGGIGAAGSAKAQKRQIAWERERAQNAHQWEVADLKAAGLNPILSAGGSGAATSGIDAINEMEPIAEGIQNAVNSAANFARLKNETEANKSQIDNVNADTALKQQQAISEAYNQGLINANTAKSQVESNLTQQKIKQIRTEIEAKKTEIENIKARTDLTKYEKQKMITEAQNQLYQIQKIKWEMETKPTSIPGSIGYDIGRSIFSTAGKIKAWTEKKQYIKPKLTWTAKK